MNANRRTLSTWMSVLTFAAAVALYPATANAAATIVIINTNAPNVGFNDPTPAAPIGGNPGTTLGQQRLNAFQAAAAIWGANLDSSVTIRIDSAMVPLSCTATTATLGSAGPTSVFSFSSGTGVFLNTWYPKALVNKLVGVDVNSTVADIRARFNSNLGLDPSCLPGSPFYLGLDNNHGTLVDLVTVLLHEFGHGLGFINLTGQSGSYLGPPFRPDVTDYFMLDNTTNQSWIDMTDTERATSALNARQLAWTGPNVTALVPSVLLPGTPQLTASAPAAVAGTYLVGSAAFGPALTTTGTTGEVMPVTTPTGGGPACGLLTALDSLAVAGKIALIDRGVCGFTVKVKNAQLAGAIGVIIANNVAGSPPGGLGGTDPTIVIPAVMITQADGAKFKDALKTRSRTRSGVIVKMFSNGAVRQGADAAGRALLYTPNPYAPGSSVSHWDTSAFRNLLMEPFINGDLEHAVTAPFDLTLAFLHDIGW